MLNNLVSERKRAGLTREEVGEKIHRSEYVIGKWERGESHRFSCQTPSIWQSSTDAPLTI